MKLIIVFLCALSVYGCWDDVAKSKQVYRVKDYNLQYILNSISDRLDNIEGLRGPSSVVVLRTEKSAKNESQIISQAATVVTIDMGTVETGDYIDINGVIGGTKGGTGGTTFFTAWKTAGTAVLAGYHSLVSIDSDLLTHSAGDTVAMSLSGILRVTSGGSLVLFMQVTSNGSSITIDAGRGQLWARVVRGTS